MKRKKNWLLKLLTLMLIVTMGIADPAGISMVTAKAASPALSAKTLSIVVGQSCNLKLKNCTKKVTFTRSNTNVTISRVNSTTVKITGRKKGSAKITAKVGSKKYTCKVTVSNPKINMNIFKKKSIREWFERMSYGNDTGYLSFNNTSQLKNALPYYIRREFEYSPNYPRDSSWNTLVPKNVIHNYVYNTFGIKVSSINLPVNNGSYVISPLWWQINTDFCFSSASPTTQAATIIIKEYGFTSTGSRGALLNTHYFTVKKANNSKGFVITSVKYKSNTVKPSIKLNKSSATIYTAGTTSVQLKATVIGSSKTVSWTSSNKNVAVVNSSGKVTAKSNGSATITATANGVSAKCKITVIQSSIKLNKSSATIYTSGTTTVQLTATVVGPNNSVSWVSSNKNVATVNSSGKVTAKNSGSTTITATANGLSAKCTVNVKKRTTALNPYKHLEGTYCTTTPNRKTFTIEILDQPYYPFPPNEVLPPTIVIGKVIINSFESGPTEFYLYGYEGEYHYIASSQIGKGKEALQFYDIGNSELFVTFRYLGIGPDAIYDIYYKIS